MVSDPFFPFSLRSVWARAARSSTNRSTSRSPSHADRHLSLKLHPRPTANEPLFRPRSSSLGISKFAPPLTHPQIVHSRYGPQCIVFRCFGWLLPLSQRVPSLPFLTISTVSSVPWAAGLLRPAANHGVHLVSRFIAQAYLFALLKVPLQRSRQALRDHCSERAPACFAYAPVVASKLPLRPVAEGFHPKRSPLRCFHPTKRSPLAQRTPHHLARPFCSSCDDRLGEQVHCSVLPSRRWMFICIIRPRYRPPCEGLPRSRLTRSRFREMHLILSTSRP